jgi:hypothetical protein
MDVPNVHFAKTSGGVQIACQTLGEGPDLLFQLGWPSQLLVIWDHPAVAGFFRKLAWFSRLILFDGRGTAYPTVESLARLSRIGRKRHT